MQDDDDGRGGSGGGGGGLMQISVHLIQLTNFYVLTFGAGAEMTVKGLSSFSFIL